MHDKQAGSGSGKGGGKSWLQTRQAEGFFKLWSGTVGTLRQLADAAKKAS